jgi:hypothetical protein
LSSFSRIRRKRGLGWEGANSHIALGTRMTTMMFIHRCPRQNASNGWRTISLKETKRHSGVYDLAKNKRMQSSFTNLFERMYSVKNP